MTSMKSIFHDVPSITIHQIHNITSSVRCIALTSFRPASLQSEKWWGWFMIQNSSLKLSFLSSEQWLKSAGFDLCWLFTCELLINTNTNRGFQRWQNGPGWSTPADRSGWECLRSEPSSEPPWRSEPGTSGCRSSSTDGPAAFSYRSVIRTSELFMFPSRGERYTAIPHHR